MSNQFVIERPDGSTLRVSGYKAAAPPPDAQVYAASESPVGDLPPRVDLRPFMTKVENQGGLNSCVANAVAGAYEYLVKRHLGEDAYDVSRLFVYYNARAVDGSENQDEGAVISSAIVSLRDNGACSEQTWPYREHDVNEEPPEHAYEEAAEFLIEDFQQIPTDLDAWKHALAEGYPIVFGMLLFESFDKHRRPGVVPMPTQDEAGRGAHGGHAMLAVGYSDPDELFIIRNSWGEQWGDEGYCYIPYRYLMHPSLNGGDSWIMRRIEPIEADEAWDEDDSSMLEELDTLLGGMDEDSFSAFLQDLGDVALETRLAALFLYAANADGEVSDEELDELGTYLEHTLAVLGSPYEAAAVLNAAIEALDSSGIVSDTVEILGRHLDSEALALIAGDLEQVVGADGLSDDEDALVWDLISAWQLADGFDEHVDAEAGGDPAFVDKTQAIAVLDAIVDAFAGDGVFDDLVEGLPDQGAVDDEVEWESDEDDSEEWDSDEDDSEEWDSDEDDSEDSDEDSDEEWDSGEETSEAWGSDEEDSDDDWDDEDEDSDW